jgi:hypothetical protein
MVRFDPFLGLDLTYIIWSENPPRTWPAQRRWKTHCLLDRSTRDFMFDDSQLIRITILLSCGWILTVEVVYKNTHFTD